MAGSTGMADRSRQRRRTVPETRIRSNDIVDAQTRSRMMAAVGQKDTGPELKIRAILRGLGIRYRVHNRDLPGSPDVAHRGKRWAIFVNGCFWHGHKNCTKTKSGIGYRVPKTRTNFWADKLLANRSRDALRCRELRRMGYRVLILWECALRDADGVVTRLRTFCKGVDRVCKWGLA
jgi:DNA mismatch endonuclease (patch repair protein)